MTEIHGTGVSGGIAMGKIRFYQREKISVKRRRVSDAGAELKRLSAAKADVLAQLDMLYQKALKEVGDANAQIFDIHKMMLEDQDYNDAIENFIRVQSLNAEYAVALTSDNFSEMFSSMEDEYMRSRAADVKDISDRLIANLTEKAGGGCQLEEQTILCADDLAPSETVQIDKSKVFAFCMSCGSANSHTAILARTMNIPAVIALGDSLAAEYDGCDAIVDGDTGMVYIQPSEQIKSEMMAKRKAEQRKKELLQNLRGKENVTRDGKRINVYANIGGLRDMGAVLANDAGGIGLFRSEFLYLEGCDYPDEETQFQCYKKVLERMSGKRVIIRTLDIGADKQIDYFNLKKEENPALGLRAIRICLTRPEVFRVQLRALYRASAYGSLGIMFPMITSVEEITEIKKMIQKVKQELADAKIPFRDDVEIGIMIETPAAVMISDLLAKEVDFFSIGTNDLTQYTLAADRQNPELDRFCNPHHKAVLRMIKLAADNAHSCGAWIGICGELGGDLSLTELFLAMGIDELSVSPSQVLSLREKIRNTQIENQETLLKQFLS